VLEFKATLTGSIGKGFNLAMIFKTTAVKNDLGDFVSGGSFGDEFSYFKSSGYVGPRSGFSAEFLFCRIDRDKGFAYGVVNNLSSDVATGKVNCQARTSGSTAELFTQASVSKFSFICDGHGLLDGFAFLAADLFTNEADALAFVWLRWIVSTNICGTLTNDLLINAFY